jgi:hypothetical protein
VFKGTCLKWKTGFLLESRQWLGCRLTTKRSEFNFWQIYQKFFFLKWQDWLRAYPASYPLCSRYSFLGDKCVGTGRWLLSSSDVKDVWSYISTLPSVLMAWHSIKHRKKDNFTVHLTCIPNINILYCVLSVKYGTHFSMWSIPAFTQVGLSSDLQSRIFQDF